MKVAVAAGRVTVTVGVLVAVTGGVPVICWRVSLGVTDGLAPAVTEGLGGAVGVVTVGDAGDGGDGVNVIVTSFGVSVGPGVALGARVTQPGGNGGKMTVS